MKRILLLIFTIFLLTSCYPVKEIISDNYIINNELNFKILRYSEPTNNGYYVRSNDDKYVTIKIVMTNKSSTPKEVSFNNYYIVNDKNNIKSPLWRVNRAIEPAGTENKSVKFKGLETKNLWLHFLAPKNEQIKFLIYNDKIIELKFGKTKQSIF